MISYFLYHQNSCNGFNIRLICTHNEELLLELIIVDHSRLSFILVQRVLISSPARYIGSVNISTHLRRRIFYIIFLHKFASFLMERIQLMKMRIFLRGLNFNLTTALHTEIWIKFMLVIRKDIMEDDSDYDK